MNNSLKCENKIKVPRILISAIKSGSGKTMITCGLIRALIKKQFTVSARKCGPDYIDPMFHRIALKVNSGNLDSFFVNDSILNYQLLNHSDITVIEGVMGFYDGLGGISTTASSYDIARITKTPVILIVDAKGASVTLSAMINGVLNYKEDNNIVGIILNRVSKSFYERIRNVIEVETNTKVIGFVPEIKEASIESRYLGLMQPEEIKDIDSRLNIIADSIIETVDIDELIRIAEDAEDLCADEPEIISNIFNSEDAQLIKKNKPRIAIARDEAFSFYYNENIVLLNKLGADIIYFSPLNDEKIPDEIDGLIFYGGYPELHAKDLSLNNSMISSINKAYSDGIPIIAECGGFMYLQNKVSNARKQEYDLCGVIDASSFYTGHLVRFGYIEAKANYGGLYGNKDALFKGHEFHHFDSTCNGYGFDILKPLSNNTYSSIVYDKNIAAGFPHIYALSNPDVYVNYLKEAVRYRMTYISKKHWDSVAKPLNSLGVLEEHVVKLYSLNKMSGNMDKYELKPALVQFCADHGVVCEGVTQTDSKVTKIVADNFVNGKSSVNYMASIADTDVFTFDIGMDCAEYPNKEIKTHEMINRKISRGSNNLRVTSALSRDDCLKAINTGKEIVAELKNKGYNAIALGEMGIGNTTPTAVLAGVMLNLNSATVCGRGAGLSDEGYNNKINVVNDCLTRIKSNGISDPIDIMAEGGGYEIAAMTGVILGGLNNNIPVILDGCITCVAALMACSIDKRCEYVLLPSHESAEISGKLALEKLNLMAPIKAGLCLGEGTGAMMYIPMLKMALSVYNNMSSFEEIKVNAYEKFN